MLASILAWSPDSSVLLYSALSGENRKVFYEQIGDEIRYELKMKESDWFEVDFIHNEQCLVHDWKTGIYLYDLKLKKSQLLRKTTNCRAFNFDVRNKQLFYNNMNDFYQYSHTDKKTLKLMNNISELIVDPVHRSFIAVDAENDSSLNIFYKNESVKQINDAFMILTDKNYKYCYYCSEKNGFTEFFKINLETLTEEKVFEFDGYYHHGNNNQDYAHFTIKNENQYTLVNFNKNNEKITVFKKVNIDENIYSALSPDGKKVAILMDSEELSEVKILDND